MFGIEELTTMKLHTKKQLSNLEIIRVNKGWIYIFTKKVFCSGVGEQIQMTSTFVPEY